MTRLPFPEYNWILNSVFSNYVITAMTVINTKQMQRPSAVNPRQAKASTNRNRIFHLTWPPWHWHAPKHRLHRLNFTHSLNNPLSLSGWTRAPLPRRLALLFWTFCVSRLRRTTSGWDSGETPHLDSPSSALPAFRRRIVFIVVGLSSANFCHCIPLRLTVISVWHWQTERERKWETERFKGDFIFLIRRKKRQNVLCFLYFWCKQKHERLASSKLPLLICSRSSTCPPWRSIFLILSIFSQAPYG